MQKIVILNRIPLIDSFFKEMVASVSDDPTFVTKIDDLLDVQEEEDFDFIVISKDDRMDTTVELIKELSFRSPHSKIIVYDNFDEGLKSYEGVHKFIGGKALRSDFDSAFNMV